MSRSIIGGGTDYSHQTLKDIQKDFKNWEIALKLTIASIENTTKVLKKKGYWDNVPFDFKNEVAYSMIYFATCLEEITKIDTDIQTEVRNDHISRIKSLGITASKLNNDFGISWHREYGAKDYENEDFRLVETIYQEGRNMAVDLLDLSNVAIRLKDFIGMSNKNKQNDKDLVEVKPGYFGININIKELFRRIGRRFKQ